MGLGKPSQFYLALFDLSIQVVQSLDPIRAIANEVPEGIHGEFVFVTAGRCYSG